VTTQTTTPSAGPTTGTHPTSVNLPSSFNYVGAFLTFRCPYHCSYCINRFGGGARLSGPERPGEEWIRFFSRLDAHGLPVTLQGGEPGMHPDFIQIVNETLNRHPVDILSTLEFDLRAFIEAVDPKRLNREAPYAPIRVSYHPEQFSLVHILDRVLMLQRAGFRIGLYAVEHPRNHAQIEHARIVCAGLGVDFRTKPFLGWHEGRLQGSLAYPDACSLPFPRKCMCAPSELLVGPDGFMYHCHHHLYHKVNPSGHISNPPVAMSDDFAPCSWFGNCNPCDVKVKNNRFQSFGHVSVRIRLPD
jgi:hypothetical protein